MLKILLLLANLASDLSKQLLNGLLSELAAPLRGQQRRMRRIAYSGSWAKESSGQPSLVHSGVLFLPPRLGGLPFDRTAIQWL